MSSIGSTPPGFGTTGFGAAGQVSLDEARQQDLLRTGADLALDEATPAALVDPGEAVLGLSAWDGADAPRMLPRDAAFASQLGAMDRADAAHAGVDGILSAL